MQHKLTKRYENFGSALGVTIGCLLGMFPLLLMDANKDQEKKRKKLRLLFQNIFHELSEIIEADGATLFLCDEKEELYSFTFLNKDGMKVDEIRVPTL